MWPFGFFFFFGHYWLEIPIFFYGEYRRISWSGGAMCRGFVPDLAGRAEETGSAPPRPPASWGFLRKLISRLATEILPLFLPPKARQAIGLPSPSGKSFHCCESQVGLWGRGGANDGGDPRSAGLSSGRSRSTAPTPKKFCQPCYRK